MRLPALLLTVVVVSALNAASPPQNINGSDAATVNVITKLEYDWDNALRNHDQAAIDRIVAPDCILVSSTGDRMRKEQADIENRLSTLISSSIMDMSVRVFGDTAIVVGSDSETSKNRNQDTSGKYRWTDVFVRRNGQWQVVSAQSTRIE